MAPPPGAEEEIAVSVVTVAELRLGVLLAENVDRRAARLATLRVAEALEPLLVDDRVGAAWAPPRRHVESGREANARQRLVDRSTALAHDFAVLTQDADFDVVPDLRIVKL